MGFFKSIFGINSSSHEKLQLDDPELGSFTALTNDGESLIWKGHATFLGQRLSLFIIGEKTKLNEERKMSVQHFLANEPEVTASIKQELKAEFDQAGKSFIDLEKQFTPTAISDTGHGLEITVEEKETYRHFNIHFTGLKATGISIDT